VFAWGPGAHETAAREAAGYFPQAIKKIVAANMKEYLEGVRNEPELFDSVLGEKKDFSRDYFRYSGISKYMDHFKRIAYMMSRKTDPKVLAFEIGQFTRNITDLMEPIPSDSNFPPLETAGNRVFFMSDFDAASKRFDFMFNGDTYIDNIPSRINTDIDFSNIKAEIIYSSYKNGQVFKNIDSDAQSVMNRALNLATDTIYTIYMKRNSKDEIDFKPEQFLKLGRFHKNSGNEKSIPGPKAPKTPTPPSIQEKKK